MKKCLVKDCDGVLEFKSFIGAPGVGQFWNCNKCGTVHHVHGTSINLASEMRPEDVEMDPDNI